MFNIQDKITSALRQLSPDHKNYCLIHLKLSESKTMSALLQMQDGSVTRISTSTVQSIAEQLSSVLSAQTRDIYLGFG